MGKKLYPTDTLKQAKSLLTAWDLIDPSLQFGPSTPDSLSADLASVDDLAARIRSLKTELLDLRNQRDAACIEVWDKVKRTRAGIKAIYGDDSTEYQIAGGTRRSDRKRPRRIEPAQAGPLDVSGDGSSS